MALQLRRGLDAARTAITPAEGEILYATDTKKVWVGDGTTAGGIAVGSSTLATSGVTAGTYGNSTTVPVFAVDTYGRVTSVSNTGISFPNPGFTQIGVGANTIYASSYSGAFSLVAGSNVTLSSSGSAITISSTGGGSSSGPTWTSNTTMGGSMTVTSPTGYNTSGSRLVVVVVGTMSGSTTNFSLTSGTTSWSTHTSGSNTFVYSTPTGTSVGASITISPSTYSNYAMAYAYIQTSATSTYTMSGNGTGTSGSISNPSPGSANPRIIGVSTSQYLDMSTAYSTVTGGGPTWSGSGAVHGSTTSLSVAVWTGTGSWTSPATPTLTSNPSLSSWYITGIAS